MRFILGIIIGIAAGAALGLIIAPQSGRETRDALRKRMNTADEAAERYRPRRDRLTRHIG